MEGEETISNQMEEGEDTNSRPTAQPLIPSRESSITYSTNHWITKIVSDDVLGILRSTCRVVFKGFLIGGSLHAGLGLLAGVTNRKIFTRPMVYIPGLFSKDLFRFGTFIAVSGGSYKIVTKLLQKWLRERGKDERAWWIPVIAGLVAGLASSIDEPNRRRNLLLFIIARAVGSLVKTLNKHGQIPTIPYTTPILFGVLEGLIITCITHYPYLLPRSYYNAVLRWSQYYTEEKLTTYFRQPGSEFIPCNHLMHPGSCHGFAVYDFCSCLMLYLKIHGVLYTIPLVLFRSKEFISKPFETMTRFFTNTVMSSLFLAIDGLITKYTMCLYRNWDGRPPPAPSYISFVSGMLGAIGLLLERPSRQLELLYYTSAQAFYIIWRLLCIKKPLKLDRTPFGSIWLFSLCLMAIMYAHVHERDTLAPLINRALDFLLED